MRALIRWFVDNPIAANFLMLAMLIGGFVGAEIVKKETFPTYSGNRVDVNMTYPGASSSEVEQQIIVRIEEAVADLPGIFQITSESRQGYGQVNISVVDGYDVRELLADVKSRVDAINTFPVSAERPVIKQNIRREFLMWMSLYGDADLRQLKKYGYQIRDEMALLDGISEVRIIGLKEDEVSIEVSEHTLRQYNLTFDEIANAIRRSSLNMSAGAIRSKDGDIQIQTQAQAFDGMDFANIVVRSEADGGVLLLSDIAEINDGFAEQYVDFSMNGKPGLNMEVKMSDDPKLFEGTENARNYVENFNTVLPEGLQLKINFESKSIFDSRFNLLKDNALSGLILVFAILMLFLRPLLAFWVVAGIATTFAGAIWLLPFFDVSINMISMFAFIMVLGIVVDDAIIIGESVYRHQQRGEEGKQAVLQGAKSVVKPVFLAVVSTIAFFIPLIDVPSDLIVFTRSLFFVVMLCLIFSLVESFFILPSHLSHMKPEKPARHPVLRGMETVRLWFSDRLEHMAENHYQIALKFVMQNRVSTFLAFFFMFVIAVMVVVQGWIKMSPFPNVPQPMVMVNIGFADGTPFHKVQQIAQHIRDQADILNEDAELREKNGGQSFIREMNKSLNGMNATIFVGLTPDEERTVNSADIVKRFRELVGPIPEAQSFSLNASLSGGGPEITLNLNILENLREVQQAAVDDVTQALSSFEGVFNVRSNLDTERTEVDITLKPTAEPLGLALSDVVRQVRQGFYGEEIQRIPRAKEDVRVMLRYPMEERQALDTLKNIRVRTPLGYEVPIEAVANIQLVPGPSVIRRVDRMRNITITAEVEDGFDANQIVNEMEAQNLAVWEKTYSGFNLSADGNLRTQAQFGDNFAMNFIKVFVIVWAVFAIAFRSLFQPWLIMLAVPFGFVGAVIGHGVLGSNITFFSMFGFLACSGVVVNDNLVLIERINQLRERGYELLDAVMQAGLDRFRPIVLTSITTFIGLLPILFERSLQAKFLVPMVISLSFGVAFSSIVTLFLVPCSYYSGYRIKSIVKQRVVKTPSQAAHASDGVIPRGN